jgi:hypothetical protein
MSARLSATGGVGLALILAPMVWLGGWACWNYTRIWAPLEMGVALPRGHTRTAEFRVNLESDYSIALETNLDHGWDHVPCADGSEYCGVIDSRLRAPWSLTENGKVVDTGVGQPDEMVIWGNQPARIIGWFHAGKGVYRVDWTYRKTTGDSIPANPLWRSTSRKASSSIARLRERTPLRFP